MIEVNLLSDNTDLAHVKDLYTRNLDEETLEIIRDFASVLLDAELSPEEQRTEMNSIRDELPEESDIGITEEELNQAINGFENFQRAIPEEFENSVVVYKYLLGLGESLEDAESSKGFLQDSRMDYLTAEISREDEPVNVLAI